MTMHPAPLAPPSIDVAVRVHRVGPVYDAGRPDVLFDDRMARIAGIDFGDPVVGCGACGMLHAARAPDDATLARYDCERSKYDYPHRSPG